MKSKIQNPNNGKVQMSKGCDLAAGSLKLFWFLSLSCFGIWVLFLILIINMELPNNPVKRGRRGSLISRFKTHKPRKPEIKKMNNAIIFFFSVAIKKKETEISNQGINFGIKFWIFGIIRTEGKEIKIRIKIAARLP